MNQQELIKAFGNELEQMYAIMQAKNHDYAGDGDAFKNFKLVEFLGGATVEQGFVTRLSDKLSRIATLIHSEAKVKDEKITDTLRDMANYSILMLCYLNSK
jgi:hypothetical protein